MSGTESEDLARFAYAFGVRLEAARMTLALSPMEMTELLGCARSTYTQYIRGDSMIAAYRLRPLVERGISADYLLFGVHASPSEDIIAALAANEAKAREEREKPSTKGPRRT